MKDKTTIYIIITVLVVAGLAWFAFSGPAPKYDEGVTVGVNIKGNPEATVKLVEYSDFECPACAGFQPLVNDTLEKYGNSISFEYKHFPLNLANPSMHKFSVRAAQAAEAAGQQGKFFEYHDLLFKNQKEWSEAAEPETLFVKYAGDLNLDLDQFKRQMRSTILKNRIKDDFAEGRKLGITGTPTFFLNGQKMVFNSVEGFTGQIEAAINPGSASSTVPTSNVKFGI